jgi:hypothetical protein
MTIAHDINEDRADMHAIKPGWFSASSRNASGTSFLALN